MFRTLLIIKGIQIPLKWAVLFVCFNSVASVLCVCVPEKTEVL